MNKLLIIGAGGHGRVIYDIALSLNKYDEIKFLDDGKDGDLVLGKVSEFEKFISSYEFIVGIGDGATREKLLKLLESKGASVASLVHKSAVVGSNVSIGKGTVVMAGCVINNSAKIGDGVIVNTCASIDHDAEVGDYTHVSIGARIAGTVKVGKRSFVGPGAIVCKNLKVTDETIIGAGAVVLKDIIEKGLYIGAPAKLKGE